MYASDVSTKTASGSPRERILQTASDLFYRNGYRATGINEIIRKSGVAKATFYAHFPSKETLAVAYIQSMSQRDIQSTKEGVQSLKGAEAKLIAIVANLEGYVEQNHYRGCAYLNMSSEVIDPQHPIRKEGKLHYETEKAIILDLMKDLKKERGPAWRDRDPQHLTEHYMLILVGALAMAEVYHELQPIHAAVESVKRLLQ
jgi:AcrR family transcriptional regulator